MNTTMKTMNVYQTSRFAAWLAIMAAATPATAHEGGSHNLDRPDAHAPIGVMRDHTHKQGELMLSYRATYMNMEDNRDGTDTVSVQQVLDDYKVAPTAMPMWMHMFGAMYGVTDTLTISVMGGFADKEMDNVRRDGSTFTMDNDGITDTQVNALYRFYDDGQHRLQFNAGLSLPTGSVDDRRPNGAIFAYPMQMGSGTYGLLPGISYSGFYQDWSWGGQMNATVRLGENDRDYSFGNRYQLTGWGARRLSDWLSVSLRLDGQRSLYGPAHGCTAAGRYAY